MSIDANIVGVSRMPNGEYRLTLEQPDRSRCAGQSVLFVSSKIDPSILLGRAIWGSSNSIMCGEIEFGIRVGYTGIVIDEFALDEIFWTGAGFPRVLRGDV